VTVFGVVEAIVKFVGVVALRFLNDCCDIDVDVGIARGSAVGSDEAKDDDPVNNPLRRRLKNPLPRDIVTWTESMSVDKDLAAGYGLGQVL
jgi:hypothetical protein